MFTRFASLATAAAVLLFTAPIFARKNLILDTDIFSDCDDVAAIQLAATSPDVRLLAVNVNTNSSYSALAVSAVLAHYGHETTPVGAPTPLADSTFFDSRDFSLGEFASKIAYHWSGGTLRWGHAATDVHDPIQLYRRALAASEDGSVTIVSLGFLGNLAGLLDSPADDYSDLPGPELISAKVSELVVMGGTYPAGVEWNFAGSDPASAAHVVNDWPGRMVFSGYELGASVHSGMRLVAEGPSNDPVRAAYIYYSYGRPRGSWDPITVLYAIRGLSDIFEYDNDNGYNHVNPDGSNTWIHDDAVTNQHYLRLRLDNSTVGDELDRLYLEAAWMAENPLLKADMPWVPRFPRFPKLEL